MVEVSQTAGTLSSFSVLSVRRLAAMAGREAFLAPLTSTRPERRWPPTIRSLSITYECTRGRPGNSSGVWLAEFGNQAQ